MRTSWMALWLATLGLSPASAQIPERFSNLQVLPQDVSRADLVMRMRGLAGDLGVRCNHCHVGPDDLSGMDFATDERPAKRVAREMLRMVEAANASIASLPARETPRERVRCSTCHRGAIRPPLPLEEELVRAVLGGGPAAAAARFAELRRDHLLDGRYDLRPNIVARAARRLLDAKRLDEALAVARLNLEHDASSAETHLGIGEAMLAREERDAARDSYRKALSLDPGNAHAVFRLKQLETPSR